MKIMIKLVCWRKREKKRKNEKKKEKSRKVPKRQKWEREDRRKEMAGRGVK